MEVYYLMFCNNRVQKGNVADMQTSLGIHEEVLFLLTALLALFAKSQIWLYVQTFLKNLCTTQPTVVAFMVRDIALHDIFSTFTGRAY